MKRKVRKLQVSHFRIKGWLTYSTVSYIHFCPCMIVLATSISIPDNQLEDGKVQHITSFSFCANEISVFSSVVIVFSEDFLLQIHALCSMLKADCC